MLNRMLKYEMRLSWKNLSPIQIKHEIQSIVKPLKADVGEAASEQKKSKEIKRRPLSTIFNILSRRKIDGAAPGSQTNCFFRHQFKENAEQNVSYVIRMSAPIRSSLTFIKRFLAYMRTVESLRFVLVN